MNEHHHSATPPHRDPASFRDPSGFVFSRDGVVYRQVNRRYAEQYDRLMSSGLYQELTTRKLMVAHEEVHDTPPSGDGYKLLRPARISFISYPYEWCFSELQDAALLTLKVQKIALRHGMTLKDASAYNVQFNEGRPILIDTLSFERYEEGAPWVAYRQFCRHFLAPLAMISFRDVRLNNLLRTYIDGIPLDLASELLPWRSWFNAGAFFHIHLHAKSEKRYAETATASRPVAKAMFDRVAMENLVHSLRDAVSSLHLTPNATRRDEYQNPAADEKLKVVKRFVGAANPRTVWNIGMNGTSLARAASAQGIPTVTFDSHASSVEMIYRAVREGGEKNLLPLIFDITNPTPGLGWANEERQSLASRGPADLVLALDLIHHLSIGNNVPLGMSAEFFADIGHRLVIEFIPKEDPQVERLLRNRADIFGDYSQEQFERAFGEYFIVRETFNIPGTKRILYLMERR